MTRRDLLMRGGVAAAAVSGAGALAGAAAAAPAKSGAFTGTLRVITLGVEWPTPEVQKKAEADLGFKFALTVTDPVTMVQKAITAPETFDVFGGYNYQYIQMYASHHLLPVDTRKLTAWPQLYKLFAWGKVHPGCEGGDLRRRRRSVPGALPQAGHDRAAADQGRTEVEQGHRPVGDQRGDQQDEGPDASVDRRSAGALQRRLDRLQRRRPQEAAEPGRLAGAPEQAVEGQGRAAQGPRHRHAGRRQRAQGPRHLQAEGHGQHDEGRDRPGREGRHHLQEGRAVPRLLGELQRVGQPDGLEGGRGRVDVVAGGGAPGRPGHQRQVREAAHGLPGLVQRSGHRGARRVRSRRSCRPATTTSTGCTRAGSARRSCARATTSATGPRSRRGSRRTARPTRPAASRSRPTSTTSGTTAPARRAICRASPARSATSRRARSATVARSRQRIGHYSSWNSYFTNNRVPDQAVERLPQRLGPDG